MKKHFCALITFAVLAVASIGGVMAADLSDYAENRIVDALFRGQALDAPASWHLALYTDTCTDAGPGAEISTSGTAYGRQAVASSLANWAGTQAAGSTSASTGTSGTTSNNGPIVWPESTAAWGTIQSVGFVDTATAGNRWVCINLTAPFAVASAGVTVRFNVGALQFQIDD